MTENDPVTENDNDAWVEALAGREPRDRNDVATRDARALRAALQAAQHERAIAHGAQPAAVDAARESELLARAGRAGLVPRPRGIASRGSWLAAAASIALIGVGLAWLQRAEISAPIVRSVPDAAHRVIVADPEAAKRELIAALAAAGVEARGYERLGVPGIDADLPQPLTAPVRAVLRRFDIPEPRDGVLRVEFEDPEVP